MFIHVEWHQKKGFEDRPFLPQPLDGDVQSLPSPRSINNRDVREQAEGRDWVM